MESHNINKSNATLIAEKCDIYAYLEVLITNHWATCVYNRVMRLPWSVSKPHYCIAFLVCIWIQKLQQSSTELDLFNSGGGLAHLIVLQSPGGEGSDLYTLLVQYRPICNFRHADG